MTLSKTTSILTLGLLFALSVVPKSAAELNNRRMGHPTSTAIAATVPLQVPASPSLTLPDTVPQGTMLRIDGSSVMQVINQALQQNFQQQFPGTQVSIANQGSTEALQALTDRRIDLAAIARPLTESEKSAGFTAVPVSRNKIAVLVGPENSYRGNLTIQEFVKIFRGEITDWSELGREPGPIRLVDRPESSDTRQAFARYGVFQDAGNFQAGTTAQAVADTTDAVVQALGKDGIGYAIANQVTNRSDVQIVTMHDTLPDDQRYPFSQPLSYVYQGVPSPAIAAFLGYATAGTGQQVIDQAKQQETNAIAAGVIPSATTAVTSPAATATGTASPMSPSASSTIAPSPDAAIAAGGITGTSATGTTGTVPAAGQTGTGTRTTIGTMPDGLPPWVWLLPIGLLGLLLLWLRNRRQAGAKPIVTSESLPNLATDLPPSETPEAPSVLAARTGSVIAADRISINGDPHPVTEVDRAAAVESIAERTPDLAPDTASAPATSQTTASPLINGIDLGDAALITGAGAAAGATIAGLSGLREESGDRPAQVNPQDIESNRLESNRLTSVTDDSTSDLTSNLTDLTSNLTNQANTELSQGTNSFDDTTVNLQSQDDSERSNPALTDLSLPSTLPDDVASVDVAADDVMFDDAVSGDAVSGDVVSRDAVSGDVVSRDVVSGDVVSRDVVSGDVASSETALPSSLPSPEILAAGGLGAAAILAGLSSAPAAASSTAELQTTESPAIEPETVTSEAVASEAVVSEAVAAEVIKSEAVESIAPTPTVDSSASVAAVIPTDTLSTSVTSPLAADPQTTDAQSFVEAAKYDVGQTDLSSEELASVDADLPELPDSYGDRRIVLLPRDPQWAYLYWDISEEQKAAVRQQGGSRLALRLYDVTDIDLGRQNPHSLQEYDCHETAKDWYLPIPISDRDYIAEIGYVAHDGRWLQLARSTAVRIPPIHTSNWVEAQFASVDWNQDLPGELIATLHPSAQFDRGIHSVLYDIAKGAESQRLAGSLYGSMQQESVSSFAFASGIGMGASGAAIGSMSGIGMSGMGMLSSFAIPGYTQSGAGMSGVGLYSLSGVGMMSGIGLYSTSGMGLYSTSGVGMYSTSGIGMYSASGVGMYSTSGIGMYSMSGVGFSASAPPVRPRQFWLVAEAELIVYGATEPDAILTIAGNPVKLNPDGTFRIQVSFPDGQINYPIMAVAADGEQNRSIHLKFTRETPSRNTNTKSNE